MFNQPVLAQVLRPLPSPDDLGVSPGPQAPDEAAAQTGSTSRVRMAATSRWLWSGLRPPTRAAVSAPSCSWMHTR
jgi:hypothetical protein